MKNLTISTGARREAESSTQAKNEESWKRKYSQTCLIFPSSPLAIKSFCRSTITKSPLFSAETLDIGLLLTYPFDDLFTSLKCKVAQCQGCGT